MNTIILTYVYTFDNLDEKNKFLKRRLTQGEIDTLYSSISNKESKSIITFQKRNHQRQMILLVNSVKHLTKK